MVEDAWLLRAMLYEVKKLRQFQVSCDLKAHIAERTHLPEVAADDPRRQSNFGTVDRRHALPLRTIWR